MKHFVQKLFENVHIGSGAKQSQIAALTVSKDPQIRINFAASTSDDVLDQLDLDWINKKYATGTVMHEAFTKAKGAISTQNGVRSDSQKVVLVMSDGGFETKKKFKVEADGLRTSQHALILAVPVSRDETTFLNWQRFRNLKKVVNSEANDLYDSDQYGSLKTRLWECAVSNPVDLRNVNLECSYILGETKRFNCTWKIPTSARGQTQWSVTINTLAVATNADTVYACVIPATASDAASMYCVMDTYTPTLNVRLFEDNITITLTAAKGENSAAKRVIFNINEMKVPDRTTHVEIGTETLTDPTALSVKYMTPGGDIRGLYATNVEIAVWGDINTLNPSRVLIKQNITMDPGVGSVETTITGLDTTPGNHYYFAVRVRFVGKALWGMWSSQASYTY